MFIHQSHPSLPYIQQDSSGIGHHGSWRDEETMLWMRQLHSCHTTLFRPQPLLIPQVYLTLAVLVQRQLTAPPFPSSPVAPCKIALRIRWGADDKFAGSHGLHFAPHAVSWSCLSSTKGSRRHLPFRRTFKYVCFRTKRMSILEQKGRTFWTLSILEHNLIGCALRPAASDFITIHSK